MGRWRVHANHAASFIEYWSHCEHGSVPGFQELFQDRGFQTAAVQMVDGIQHGISVRRANNSHKVIMRSWLISQVAIFDFQSQTMTSYVCQEVFVLVLMGRFSFDPGEILSEFRDLLHQSRRIGGRFCDFQSQGRTRMFEVSKNPRSGTCLDSDAPIAGHNTVLNMTADIQLHCVVSQVLDVEHGCWGREALNLRLENRLLDANHRRTSDSTSVHRSQNEEKEVDCDENSKCGKNPLGKLMSPGHRTTATQERLTESSTIS